MVIALHVKNNVQKAVNLNINGKFIQLVYYNPDIGLNLLGKTIWKTNKLNTEN